MDPMWKNIASEGVWEAPDLHLAGLDLDEALEVREPHVEPELSVAAGC